MTPRAVTALVLILVLGACEARGVTPEPQPSVAGGPHIPATELGAFDQSALESKFNTVFTHDDLTFEKSRYESDYHPPLGLEFTIHPADPKKRVLETSLRLPVERPESDVAIERDWFRLIGQFQPKVVDWLREQRDSFLGGDGGDTSNRTFFGPICAGFFAFGSATSSTGKATSMGYFAETQDAQVNCHGRQGS